jgi:GMP synthase (glutamine-hydrolysing)
MFDHNEPLVLPKRRKITGIILSGGKGNPYEPLNLTTNYVALMNFNLPTIGFCLGHEIIAVSYMGRIKKLPEYQNKKEKITIIAPHDPIFKGIEAEEIYLREKHNFHISVMPKNFVNLAYSDMCPYEIIRHKTKTIYGFQSHPEVSKPDGLKMMDNFMRMCNLME